MRDNILGLAQSTAGEWIAILSLVFGGCCSNVWALEAVLKSYPASGTFLTFAQFLYVAVQTVHTQMYLKDGWPRWKKNVVPLSRWMVQVVLFLAVSLMNNYAFGLKIPVTIHIIFRSGGLCVSMITGYFIGGKRYSPGQIFSVIVITIGIVLATISAPRRGGSTTTATSTDDKLSHQAQYVAGIGLLSLALFLSSWLGLWQEATYKKYGNQWREALFYNHFLSLPFFLPMYPTLKTSFLGYASSPPITLLAVPSIPKFTDVCTFWSPFGVFDKLSWNWHELAVPGALLALAINVITQGLCIRGVNRLTSTVSSTTVNLILTIRKAVSLAISVWYYGSGASFGLIAGGAMVLGGTLVYSMAAPPKLASDMNGKATNTSEKKTNGNSHSIPTPISSADGTSTAIKADGLQHRNPTSPTFAKGTM